MARSATRARKAEPAQGQSGLRVRKAADAVSALLHERASLLKRIAGADKRLATEREHQHEIAQAMFERMQPLMNEHSALLTEIHALFRALLAEGRLSKRAGKQVARVYQWFNESDEGKPLAGSASEAGNDEPDRHSHQGESGSGAAPNARVDSAKHVGGQAGNETLRSLFRRLTIALHPDLARHEHEQQRRTDVMKEVTRAYEEGNLARLLEIEQIWLAGGNVRSDSVDEAARYAELERIVRKLRAQMKALESELRNLRKASPLAQMFGSRRVSAARRVEQLDELVATASAELQPLRTFRDFVRAFSEGKISLTEFLRGPQGLSQEERDLAEAALDFLLEELDFDFEAPRGRRRPASRRSRW
jgi:predicted  nucleic acid-binding Zn-ribbon protein